MKVREPVQKLWEGALWLRIGGKIIPIRFKTEDGDPGIIDRITNVRQRRRSKSVGEGWGGDCMIGGRQIYLSHDRNDWSIEND